MSRPAQRGGLVVGLVAVAAVVTAVAAARPADDRPPTLSERIEPAEVVEGFTPALLRADRRVRVILEVEGRSVGQAQAEARARGRSLTKAEKEAIRADLRARQSGVAAAVRSAGGQVVADYQDAYNGLAAVVPLPAVAELQAAGAVEAVHPVRTYEIDNAPGAQYMNAPGVWENLGFTGDGVVVAVIDTGIDYTHADFGGAGTPEAYDVADASDTVIAGDPVSEFGSKVIGGWDFVGDDYNADSDDPAEFTPQPDPDPLDCHGHGTHVAGTALGMGVLADGSTYTGPYDPSIYGANDFAVAPGIAPEALLLAYRVFGCSGSATADIIVAAIERAMEDGADVINMSLGSPFGRPDEPDAVAANTAAAAGIVVVASAGNSGASPYITGSPGIADRAVSVAAIDASGATLPGAHLALSTGESLDALNANEAPIADGTTLEVKVLRNEDGTISLGCDPADYVDVAGKLVVTVRGTCARVARAVFGQQAGAAAVVMINTSTAFPPFEGPITENPDTGEEFTVTIPFLGVRGILGPSPTDDGDELVAADGGTVTLTNTTVTNPGFLDLASFTSGGPRSVDSAQKPDVTAPGVSVLSAGSGTGSGGVRISGTSMASPMTAGVAALVTEAHPDWPTEWIKAAIMNTAEIGPAAFVAGRYDPRRAGTGAVQADRAASTVAIATTSEGRGSLSYGYEALTSAYSEALPLTLTNTGGSPLTYDLAAGFVGTARGAEISFSSNPVTVPAGGSTTVQVTIALDAAEVAALPAAAASNFGALAHIVRGAVVATPASAGSGVYPLRVPFALVPRGLSDVTAEAGKPTPVKGGPVFEAEVTLHNGGIHAGDADVYAWNLEDGDDVSGGEDSMDVRAAGVQVLPGELLGGAASDRTLVFAVNMFGRWSNPSTNEIDIPIDTDGDGSADYFVIGVDVGAVLAGAFDGRYASFIFRVVEDGLELVSAWVATAPKNGSTMQLPLLASEIGLSAANPSFSYSVAAFSIVPEGLVDLTGTASVNVFDPAVATGAFVSLAPGESETITARLNQADAAKSKVLGWMVVTLDDASGAAQAALVPLKPGKAGGRSGTGQGTDGAPAAPEPSTAATGDDAAEAKGRGAGKPADTGKPARPGG